MKESSSNLESKGRVSRENLQEELSKSDFFKSGESRVVTITNFLGDETFEIEIGNREVKL